MTKPRSGTGYRPDIDGLRAVAVLAVIGFHASPRFVPGGFVGVDVFFVVSGYLISGILFEQFGRGTFSLADFYARRIRRIVPALLAVLVACWAIGWLVLVGDEYFQLQKHIAGGAAFVSNFLLWREAGYFDAPSESKPLLHLWSLGIEEQFYLIWPPILYLCWTRRVNLLSVAVAIIVVSFWLNVASVDHYAVAAFYLPTSRLWELLAGGLLAYIERFKKDEVDRAVQRMIFTSGAPDIERSIANLKAWVGLALILTAILVLEKSTDYPGWWFHVPVLHDLASAVGLDNAAPLYPGWWAILPVVGTALIIWAGPNAWANRAILARRGFVELGLMSYPLYLWHWPLLSFIGITESGHPSRRLKAYAVLLSFVLAWMTHRWIEQPARRTMSIQTPIRIAAVALSLILAGSVAMYSYVTGRLGPKTPQFALNVPRALRAAQSGPECRPRFPTTGKWCVEYAPDMKLTSALVGDSHAKHFLPGVGSNLAARGENVVLLGQSACPPLFDIEHVHPGESDICVAPNDSVLKFIGGDSEITRVIFSFSGASEITGNYRIAGTSLNAEESMRRAMQHTVEYLQAKNKQIWLIIQVPVLDFEISECAGRPFAFETHGRVPCAMPKAEVIAQQMKYRQMLDEIKQRFPSFNVFDPVPFMCDERWCYAVRDGRVLYDDRTHLSEAGSLFFADKFRFDK